jgi:hypothetical protein
MVLRKVITVIFLVVILLVIGACTGKLEGKIELYAWYNEDTGELLTPIEYVKTGQIAYVFFDYGKPMNYDSITMSVFRNSGNGRSSYYDDFMIIDPNTSKVIFSMEINEAAEYEIVIYFEDPDNPIAKKKLYVFD